MRHQRLPVSLPYAVSTPQRWLRALATAMQDATRAQPVRQLVPVTVRAIPAQRRRVD